MATTDIKAPLNEAPITGLKDFFIHSWHRYFTDSDKAINRLLSGIATTIRITADYTILITDEVIFADTDGGVITVSLPVGVEGKSYEISNVGSAGNILSVDPNGTETIFGQGAGVAFVMYDGEGITIHYNTTEGWR